MAGLKASTVAAKIREFKGNVSAVARAFGRNRTAMSNYIHKRPNLKLVLEEARQEMVDNVESRFYADCLKDEPQYQTSRIFFLKTQAKGRGYIERHEVSGPDGGPFEIKNMSNEELIKNIEDTSRIIASLEAKIQATDDGVSEAKAD